LFLCPRIKYIFLLIFISLASYVSADPDDYIHPFKQYSFSNYGTLGLIQNPNARFLDEGSLAFSWSHNEPYIRGSLIAYPSSWLEVSYQYVDINNRLYSQVKEFSGSQSLKDKSFDTKIRLIKESQLMPEIAIGLRDLAGTGLFSSEFIVASKNLSKSLDLTMGIGWGNISGQSIQNPLSKISERFATRNSETGAGGKFNLGDYFSGSAGYFFGIEYFVPKFKGMRIKVEYDGTNYKTENESTPISQESNFNFGIVFPQSKSLSYKLNFTRGNTLNFGFAYKLNLGNKNSQTASKEKPPRITNSNAIKIVTSRSEQNLFKGALKYLSDDKIFLQHANINNNELEIIFAQGKYRNPVIASGRALNILDQIAPNNITSFKVSELNGGVGLYSIAANRNTFIRHRKQFLPLKPDIDISLEPFILDREKYQFNPEVKYPVFFHSIGPDIRSQIGGPDGFFFGDVKLKSRSELVIKRGVSLVSDISYGLFDNMNDLKLESDSILPHVRTDIVKYLKESRNLSIQRMQLNKFGQISPSIFYKFSAGILEYMFNGYGSEVLFKPFDKNYAIGVEAWKVYQRNYDQMFGILDDVDYKTVTGHISFYFHEPKTNILFRMKGGKFLAKDSGISFEITREFYSGFRIGGFFTLTDISTEEFGEGSFDKGFSFYIPLEIFSNSYNTRSFGWGLRPITRDGGATLSHGYNLWGVAHKSHKHRFNRHIADFYD
jgi:hypothetical protein